MDARECVDAHVPVYVSCTCAIASLLVLRHWIICHRIIKPTNNLSLFVDRQTWAQRSRAQGSRAQHTTQCRYRIQSCVAGWPALDGEQQRQPRYSSCGTKVMTVNKLLRPTRNQSTLVRRCCYMRGRKRWTTSVLVINSSDDYVYDKCRYYKWTRIDLLHSTHKPWGPLGEVWVAGSKCQSRF